MRVLENWDVSSLYPNLVRLYGYSSRNQKDKMDFLQELPNKLRIELSHIMHDSVISKMDLLAMRMKAKHNELSDDFLKPLNLTNADLKLGLKLPLPKRIYRMLTCDF